LIDLLESLRQKFFRWFKNYKKLMATTILSPEKIGLRYGVIAAIAMMIYFFIINLLNLQDIEMVRFASNVIIILAVIYAIGIYKKVQNGSVSYLPGLAIGFLVGVISSVLYAAFIYIYAKFIYADYADILRNQDYYGTVLPPLMLAGAIALLGTAVGTMTGYILMMAFDKSGSDNTD
jgi:hypothetical protein